jgi:glycosyltransferase involved in cell wall biosynthesis
MVYYNLNMKDISIIIPTKNEELNLGRCLDSVIPEAQLFLNSHEVLVVDCSSLDKTIAIAKNYPVKILQLKPNWPHSAAAARFIGSLFSTGKYLFFIDADMALEKGFLEAAFDILNNDNSIAGVGGIGREIYLKNGQICLGNANLYGTRDKISRAKFLGGAALYCKQALQKVGGFNPYLSAGEENELAQRLRKEGYSLLSVPLPMINHHSADIAEWDEFLRKKKANMFTGIGEAIRLSPSVKYFLETLVYYKEFAVFLLFILWTAGMAMLVLISHKLNLAFAILLPVVFLFIVLSVKKRGLKKAFASIAKWNIISMQIIAGIAKCPENPRSYPKNPLIIKGDFNAKE